MDIHDIESFGARLREERKRLKMNQGEFGEIAGVSRKTQSDYENDLFSPNSRYLAQVAVAGVDVLYIITGQRTPTAETALSRQEAALVDNYRHTTPEDRDAISRLFFRGAESSGKRKRSA